MSCVLFCDGAKYYVKLFWTCCCLLSGINHRSWVNPRSHAGSCGAEIRKAFVCLALRQIPTMQVKHEPCQDYGTKNCIHCLSPGHEQATFKAYNTWAFKVTKCWTWGATKRVLMKVTLNICLALVLVHPMCYSKFMLSSFRMTGKV